MIDEEVLRKVIVICKECKKPANMGLTEREIDDYIKNPHFTEKCLFCKGDIEQIIPLQETRRVREMRPYMHDDDTRPAGLLITPSKEWAFNVHEEEPEGTKHDENKLRYDLIPPNALKEVIKVLTLGASKYGAYNWNKGIKFSRLYAATQRHLQAWHSLEDKDPETGISHLAHAMCSLLFLLSFHKTDRKELDDRHEY